MKQQTENRIMFGLWAFALIALLAWSVHWSHCVERYFGKCNKVGLHLNCGKVK